MKSDSERTPLGRKLVELRREFKIKSSEKVARDLGINDSSYRRYESKGDAGMVGDNLGKIAKYFGVTVDYLLGREDEPSAEISENTATEETLVVRSVKPEYSVADDPGKLSDDEKIFVNLWRALGTKEQDLVADLIESLSKNKNKAD